METVIKTDQEIITNELALAIASFDSTKVAELLSENAKFSIQNDKDETVMVSKSDFLIWLSNCFEKYISINKDSSRLDYVFDRCSYCKIGNPVIIFENGKFPVCTKNVWDKEKCGLMLEFEGNLISGISFCYLFMITDNQFHFEKKCKI